MLLGKSDNTIYTTYIIGFPALMGVPAEDCRAYEDTDLGLRSIRAAGMDAVDVREMLRPRTVV